MGMNEVLQGHARFLKEAYPRERDLFEKLAGGQSPEVLLVTCSDSRVDPSLITQTRPGDLFVIRNAGNLVPAHGTPGGEAATVEYAMVALGVKHIVVCGHSGCGAMKGLLSPPGDLASLPQVRTWLEHAQPTREHVESSLADADDDEKLARAIEHNALAQLDALRTHPAVAKAVDGGEVQLHAWVYDIGSGRISAHRPEDGSFVPLVETGG